jgi:hypothetical protein
LCICEYSFDFWNWSLYNTAGQRNLSVVLTAILVKSFKDAFGRILLMAAARGWGITIDASTSKTWLILFSGTLYFIFDVVYQVVLRYTHQMELRLLLLISGPLVALNTLIFYFVFSWFSQTFYKLNFYKQVYKLSLLRQFACVLGLAGLISLIWGVLETVFRFFIRKHYWWTEWVYIAFWDIIFFLLVVALMVIWRVSEKSKLLAVTQEIRDSEHDISQEDEGKFGIELGKVIAKHK